MSRRLTTDDLLAMRVRNPRPGQRTTPVKVRLPYAADTTVIRVDSNQYEAAMRSESATVNLLTDLARRVAALNPDAGAIGPGMLASLVTDAKRALGQEDGAA